MTKYDYNYEYDQAYNYHLLMYICNVYSPC